jgi:cytochrome c
MRGTLFPLTVGALALAGAAFGQAGGDAARGADIYSQCSGCHQIGDGAANGIGPQINHIFDRPAAAVDGFRYSNAFQRAAAGGLHWDHATLDRFLENPRSLVTQTRMSFPGLPDAQDRADVIAYLRAFSDNPRDIPEAAPTVTATDHAVAPEILAIVGDPAYGEYLSGECTACHTTDGSSSGIPSIVAWPEDVFVTALHAYKDGVRLHPVMQMMAGRLSNEEIAALAAYFSTLE